MSALKDGDHILGQKLHETQSLWDKILYILATLMGLTQDFEQHNIDPEYAQKMKETIEKIRPDVEEMQKLAVNVYNLWNINIPVDDLRNILTGNAAGEPAAAGAQGVIDVSALSTDDPLSVGAAGALPEGALFAERAARRDGQEEQAGQVFREKA